jgi:Glucose / Sorbosone dehydrogenase
MNIRFGLLILVLGSWVLAQPRVLNPALKLSTVADLPAGAFRLAYNPVDKQFYVLIQSGDIYRLDLQTLEQVVVANFADHGIPEVASLAFDKTGRMYLSGNETKDMYNTAWLKTIQLGADEWSILARTEPYPTNGGTIFNHKANAIIVNPEDTFIFWNLGSRTDHGEVRDANGAFPDLREAALTSVLLRLPLKARDLTLPNNTAFLESSGYLFAQGLRNTYDLAFNGQGELFGTENSGDRDDSDELNHLRQGHHYGFPWRMGTNNNPMQFASYNPQQDKLLAASYTASQDGSFHNDPDFPPAPMTFTDPILNYGPDADSFRASNGRIHDASETGVSIGTFSAHRSPLGLVFDKDLMLREDFQGDGFVLGWTPGSGDSDEGTGPFFDVSQDLLHLDLQKDGDTYTARVTRIAEGFNLPIDTELLGHHLYVLEYGAKHTLWELTLP